MARGPPLPAFTRSSIYVSAKLSDGRRINSTLLFCTKSFNWDPFNNGATSCQHGGVTFSSQSSRILLLSIHCEIAVTFRVISTKRTRHSDSISRGLNSIQPYSKVLGALKQSPRRSVDFLAVYPSTDDLQIDHMFFRHRQVFELTQEDHSMIVLLGVMHIIAQLSIEPVGR